MASIRRRKAWGLDHRDPNEDAGDPDSWKDSKAKKTQRTRVQQNLKTFYLELLAQDLTERKTKKAYRQTLGKLHDLMIDFLVVEELKTLEQNSALVEFLPQLDEREEFLERWLYWPTLEEKPIIQDGADGPISKKFYEQFWQGAIIRLKGDGLTKCILVPRGHLKSTLCTQAFTLWRICRDPSERHLIRSLTCQLARTFIGDLKWQFEQNKRFKDLYGFMGPPTKREMAWNADFFQVRADARRGREPTAWAMGMESEVTGGHFDSITLDDVIGETNTKTPEMRAEARLRVQRLQAVRDPSTPLIDIGTRWEDDDVHSMFIARDSDMRDDSSFMLATVFDAQNKPIWPEKFSQAALNKIRSGIPEDRIWFGQYFNQFAGTSRRTFHLEWLRYFEGIPEEIAIAKQLNLFIGIDTASGLKVQKGRLDLSSAIVLGQTPNRMNYYLLDGFNERLPAEGIAKAIVDLAIKWREVAARYGGTFMLGVEETAYTNFLSLALDYEIRNRGMDFVLSVEPLKHNREQKPERIRILALPYSQRRILWPHKLIIPSSIDEPYDLVQQLREMYDKYPSVSHDDLLDAHAYAYRMAGPRDYEGYRTPQEVLSGDPSVYTREQALSEVHQSNLAGYDDQGSDWTLGL